MNHLCSSASDSCSSIHPLKCPNGPVVCEAMGYTYECYCQPGYFLDTADDTCETGTLVGNPSINIKPLWCFRKRSLCIKFNLCYTYLHERPW